MSKDYYVVKLVTDFELLANVGTDDGAEEGIVLEVLDPETQDVVDPKTGEKLGSVDRHKARVAIEKVGEKMSLCRVVDRRSGSLSAISTIMAGGPTIQIAGSSPTWPEGVSTGDPVRFTGRRLTKS